MEGMNADQHASPTGGSSGGGSALTLPGVVDFLQRAWVQFELERAQWGTERAELTARVAQLEAECKGKDNLQRDLVRRVKMLEYAIKQERLRYSQSTNTEPPKQVVPAHVSDLKSAAPQTRLAQANNRRDVLKKYLHEIGCENVIMVKSPPAFLVPALLSKDAIAQFNNQPPSSSSPSSSSPSSTSTTSTKQTSHTNHVNSNANNVSSARDVSPPSSSSADGAVNSNHTTSPSASLAELSKSLSSASTPSTTSSNKDKLTNSDASALQASLAAFAPTTEAPSPQQPSSSSSTQQNNNKDNLSSADGGGGEMSDAELAEMQKMLVGRMKPGRKGMAGLMKNMMGGGGGAGGGGGGGSGGKKEDGKGSATKEASLELKLAPELVDLTLEDDSSLGGGAGGRDSQKPSATRMWNWKHTLKSHFDSVRSVIFHPTENALFSGSEDYTVKMWNLNSLAPQPKKGVSSSELEPIYTFRGHTGPVFAMDIHADHGRVFSAGGDRLIFVWAIPPVTLDTYDRHGVALDYRLKTLEGHTDAIWSLSHHPHRQHIVSASADGTVRLWDYEKPSPLLQTLVLSNNLTPVIAPTSAAVVRTNPHQCIAAYNSAALAVFDMETGSCVTSSEPQDKTKHIRQHQINAVVTHPTLPLAITAHEDRKIEYFDLKSGKVVHSMVAHGDAVGSLAIDSSGLYLLSGGHDSSLRFWDITTHECVQEMNAHRPKYQESIHAVAYHSTKTFVASGGADSAVRLYM